MPHNVYLCGQMTDWRFPLVAGLADAWQPEPDEEHGWPVLTNAIFGEHNYVGPYVFNHPAAAGKGSHGVGLSAPRGAIEETYAVPTRRQLINLCLRGIRLSSLVFVYVESPEAFGSAAEIGYARALDVPLAIAVHPSVRDADFWFPNHLASIFFRTNDPERALKTALAQFVQRSLAFDSALPCSKCGAVEVVHVPKEFKNGVQQVDEQCAQCHRHRRWVPKKRAASEFVMPFGKHKGKTLGDLLRAEKDYCEWAARNMENANIRKKFEELLQFAEPEDFQPEYKNPAVAEAHEFLASRGVWIGASDDVDF